MFAFLLRRVLASGFFASDPSPAMIATLGKVAVALGAAAAKHHDIRSKVLHESISLLKQLASHVEGGGGCVLGSGCLGKRNTGSAKRGASASANRGDEANEVVEEEVGPRPALGAFAAGVGVICELLVGTAGGVSQSTTAGAHASTHFPDAPPTPAPQEGGFSVTVARQGRAGDARANISLPPGVPSLVPQGATG